MTSLFAHFQRLILDPYASAYEYRHFRGQVADFLRDATGTERARTHTLSRLSSALESWEGDREGKTTGTSDLVVLLRQVIRTCHHPLEIPRVMWQLIENRALQADLYRTRESEETVTISVQPWQPTWLAGDTSTIDQLKQLRYHESALGDGLLAAMTKNRYLTYRSEGQKRAVDAVQFAPVGSTVLATLPTGGGKSLSFILPAWFASRGGKRRGGTTIVVTPTVSLALDQQRGVRDYFPEAVGPEYQPHTLTGDTPADTRKTIYRGLEEGTLPLLYTSPEALLNGTLYDVVLEAARNGYLNWLVIDEAHIADSWGAGFRTEFQLLAAYRRKLLEKSQGRVRTLLLSATISEETEQMLADLFAEEERLFKVHANQLRPEISYWFTTAADEDERHQRVVDALYHLPRPAILYVTKPEQSQEWISYLHANGFQRLAAYSGKTVDLERRSILREWERNELDLVVATSAFGLGVDKEDVRAVLHASLPESINRFYQEVGRGGRDGYQSASLLILVPQHDYTLAKAMFRAARITSKKAWYRWKSMLQESDVFQHQGDQRIVDLDAIPGYNLELEPGDTHRSWNEHILLMMQRAGLIQILDTRPESEREGGEPDENSYRRHLRVLIMKPESVNNLESFEEVINPLRKRELSRLLQGLSQLQDVVQLYSRDPVPSQTLCLGYRLADVYPHAALACGGCPYDRVVGQQPYSMPISVVTNTPGIDAVEEGALINQVARAAFLQGNLNAIWEEQQLPAVKIISLLGALVSVGFSQLIVPNEIANEPAFADKLIQLMGRYTERKQRLLTEKMVVKDSGLWSLHNMPTAVVYPPQSRRADPVYQRIREVGISPCVSIVRRHLHLPSEHGLFIDKVNGLQWTMQMLQDRIVQLRDTL